MNKFYVLFIFVFVLNGCADQKNKEEAVDLDYLSSDAYRKFENEARKEASEKAREPGLEVLFLSLEKCRASQAQHVPFVINREKLNRLTKPSETCGSTEAAANEEGEFKVHLVNSFRQEDYVLKLILLKARTVYTDWKLLAVTVKDQKLADIRKVGVFKKNLSEDFDTEIKVTKNGNNFIIVSLFRRRIIYPFEQKSSEKKFFRINSAGIIQNSE